MDETDATDETDGTDRTDATRTRRLDMIQVQGETRRILRRGERAGRWRLTPGVARKAALVIAVWVACVCAAGAGNMIVTLKANEKEIEAREVLFGNGDLQIVQPVPLPAIRKPVSEVLRIEPKDKDSADEVKRLREENANLRKDKADRDKKIQELTTQALVSQSAMKAGASLEGEMNVALLQGKKKELETERDSLKTANTRLQSDLEEARATARALASPPKPALEITGTSLSTTTLRGVARVRGEVKNEDQVPYSRVVLEILVKDSAGNPVGRKIYTFVTGLEPGAVHSFAADLELTPEEGMKSEVRAVAAKTTGGK
jgi:hypothetical protein